MAENANIWAIFVAFFYKIFSKIFGKIFGKFKDYRNKLSFGTNTDTKNLPKYSSFYFHESRYNFAKLYRSSKLLSERMALL